MRDFTAEDYLAELDAAGVHYGVVAAASFLGTYHDYTLSALERHSRLRVPGSSTPMLAISACVSWTVLGSLGFAWRQAT